MRRSHQSNGSVLAHQSKATGARTAVALGAVSAAAAAAHLWFWGATAPDPLACGVRTRRTPPDEQGGSMPYLVENSDSLMVMGDTEGILGMKRIEKAINQLESDGYLLTFVSDGYFVFYKQGGWGGSQ
jgi:hypothetical protein